MIPTENRLSPVPFVQPDLTFSFVVPVYNEQAGLETFCTRLSAVAGQLGQPYEILFVNDGSTDDTAGVIARLTAADEHIKCIEFSRNFGHQAALTAGYDHAAGRAVISLDGDCQHPPEVIPELVARWREGFEVVYTVRSDTSGISPLRRAVGRAGYRLIRALSGADLTDQADFRLMDRKAVDALKLHREQGRFLRGLVHWIGFRQIGVPYKAESRAAGKRSYTWSQTLRLAGAGLCNFSLKPLRLAYGLGGLMLVVAAVYFLAALLLWPLGRAPGALANVAMLMVGLTGLQLLAVGLLGEYVGRVFEEVKGRPLYVVREMQGFEQPSRPAVASPQPETAKPQEKSKRPFVLYT